jgi:HK97 family phage major capsid protein
VRVHSTTDTPPGETLRVEKRGGGAVALAQQPAPQAPHPALLNGDAIRFRVSNEDEDSFGDVVVQSGLEYPPSIPAVVDHSPRLESSVGDWHDVERGHRETFATLRLLPRGTSRAADLVRALHTGGFPLASSVHFDIARADIEPIVKTGANGRQMETGGKRYLRGKVREISLTQFPANSAAVAVARSLGFNDAELAALSRPDPARVAIARTITAVAGAPSPRGHPMTIAEMIAAAQAAHENAQASLGTATQALEADQSETNLTNVQRATGEVEALFTRLSTLRAAETASARRAAAAPAPPAAAPSPILTPVSRAIVTTTGEPASRSAAIVHRTETRDVPSCTRFAQLVMAASIARTRHRSLDDVVLELFPDNKEVIAIARTAVGVADSTTAGWAAELVRYETRAMLDETMNPTSIWPKLAARGTSLDFAGAHSVLIPQLNAGMTTGGAWVGEGGVIPLVHGAFTSKRLFRYKLAGIVPITKELQRVSSPAAVDAMSKLLQQFISNLLDSCLIDAQPEVPGVRPAGLLNGVTPIAGAAGGGYEALRSDLEAITNAFTAANIGTNPVLLVNSSKAFRLRTMVNALGQLVFPDGATDVLGFPVIASQFVPPTIAIAVAAEKFVSALDPLELDTSEEATLTMANADLTAPTQAGTLPGGGGLGTAAGQVVPDGGIPVSGASGASTAGYQALSLWQTWSLGVRLVFPASFGLTQPGAVQEVTAITW